MTCPSSIITELPSSLWKSPLFPAYDYYVGGIETALDQLQDDLEEMFHLKDVQVTTNYLLELNYRLNGKNKIKDLENLTGFNRLINAAIYTDYPVDSIFWLFKLATKIHLLRNPFIKTGLLLNIGNTDYGTAFVRPLFINRHG